MSVEPATDEQEPALSGPRLENVRVAIVLKWSGLGGAERQALLLARHLQEVEGAVVEVQALNDTAGRAAKLFRDSGVPWLAHRGNWRGDKPRTFARLVRTGRVLRRARVDVLLPYCDVPNVVCGLLWRHVGARTCVWNQRDTLPFTLDAWFVRRAIRATPVVIANSEHGADFLAARGARRDAIRVIPNGVALPPARASRAEWRRRLGVVDGDVVVTSLAHFSVRKNHEMLLEAWQRTLALAESNRAGLMLVLAGRPESRREALEARARHLGVDDRLRFVGDVDDVSGLLAASDVGVLCSPSEGCPNAVLESMAAGLPVVGSDIAGIREALGAEARAFLAPPDDPAALGAALARLCTDRALRVRAGCQNRTRQRAVFTSDRMLDDTVGAILDGLESSGPSPHARRR